MDHKRMICKLKQCVLTNEGDLIPEGTPVEVIGWAEGDTCRYVEVRASAYMYVDCWNHAGVEASGLSCVGEGLYLRVRPEALVFHELRTAGVRVRG